MARLIVQNNGNDEGQSEGASLSNDNSGCFQVSAEQSHCEGGRIKNEGHRYALDEDAAGAAARDDPGGRDAEPVLKPPSKHQVALRACAFAGAIRYFELSAGG